MASIIGLKEFPMLSNNGAFDEGMTIDWGKTSLDYAGYRPGPPPSFYERLAALGIGKAGQQLLDLGTGTGVIARQMARQGCQVSGIDVSDGQIAIARECAAQEKLAVTFEVAPAESIPFAAGSFDVATANQCWLYFDKPKVLAELKRVLKPEGVFVTSHYSWLPRIDPIARASEELVLKHNPAWSAKDWDGVVRPVHVWMEGTVVLQAMFFYDVEVPFTRETWRGRMRACRGVGAELTPEQVEAFDREHDALLKRTVAANSGDTFTVTHRIDASIFSLNGFEFKHGVR
jgi:SAM-dependent methyltransferase